MRARTSRPGGTGRAKPAAPISLLATFVWLVLIAAPARAGHEPGSGIGGSPHDFTAAGAYRSDGNGGTCTFCHVRHKAQGLLREPRDTRTAWNGSVSALHFSWSDATQTSGGTTLPTNLATWGSSKNCLSCHDGTVSAGGAYGPAGDLKGNHPVGLPYPYLGAPSTYNGITTGRDVDLNHYVAAPANVKLFAQVGKGVVSRPHVGAAGIECASCHDVHNENTRDRGLLRDTRRQLCLNCHC